MQNFLQSFQNNSGANGFMSKYLGSLGKPAQQTTPSVPAGPKYAGPVSANLGATSTQTTQSPAKTAYTNSLKAPVTSTPTTPIVPQNQPITGNTTTPSGAVVNTTTGATISTPTSTPQNSTTDAFNAYIQSLQPNADVTKATQNLNNLNLQAKKDQETALERGDTLGFATGEAARVNRNNSFGIDAASNTLNALTAGQTANTNANKARLDYQTSLQTDNKPFSVGDDTYQLNPTTGKYEKTATKASAAGAGFSLSPGENRYDATGKLIASGGPKPMTQAQETAQIAKTDKETAAQQSATQSISLINDLLAGNTNDITGVGQNPLNFLGLSNQKAINQYNQLQGMLKLGIRGLLKGQGAVSDYEGKILGQAASALGRNLNNEDFKQALLKIRGTLLTNSGGEANVVVKGKDGKILGQGALTGQDIYDAVKDGNTIEYQ